MAGASGLHLLEYVFEACREDTTSGTILDFIP